MRCVVREVDMNKEAKFWTALPLLLGPMHGVYSGLRSPMLPLTPTSEFNPHQCLSSLLRLSRSWMASSTFPWGDCWWSPQEFLHPFVWVYGTLCGEALCTSFQDHSWQLQQRKPPGRVWQVIICPVPHTKYTATFSVENKPRDPKKSIVVTDSSLSNGTYPGCDVIFFSQDTQKWHLPKSVDGEESKAGSEDQTW